MHQSALCASRSTLLQTIRRSSVAIIVSLALPLANNATADTIYGFGQPFISWGLDWGSNGSTEIPGRLFVPNNYDPNQSYPLVIFYHGAGQMGTNNTSQVQNQIGGLVSNAASRNFFLYAPQLPGNSNTTSWYAEFVDDTMRAAAAAMVAYNIDPSKVYVTGLSLGGGAVRYVAGEYPEPMAATMPICGTPRVISTAEADRMVGRPMWQFHAQGDPQVGVYATRNHVNDILAAQGHSPLGTPNYVGGESFFEWNNLRYTEYSGNAHNVWLTVYADAAVYDWLMAQSAPAPIASLQAGETVYFDFGVSTFPNGTPGETPDSYGRAWNTAASYGAPTTLSAVMPFARTSSGVRTSVCLSVTEPFGGPMDTSPGLSRPGYDDMMAKDGWVTRNNATETSNTGGLLIRGLIPGAPYRVEIFASHTNNNWGAGRKTRYKIGSDTRDLEPYNNTTGITAVFEAVTADAKGGLQLKVYGAPGNSIGQINTLSISPADSSAIFSQDFSSSASVGSYVNATTPAAGQFNDISAPATLAGWVINSGKLQLTHNGSGAAGFTRHTDVPGNAGMAKVEFDVTAAGLDTWSPSASLIFGSMGATGPYGGNLPYGSTTASLTMHGYGTGNYRFRVNYTDYAAPIYSAAQSVHVAWFINVSQQTRSYTGPDSQIYDLDDLKMDLWVNGARVVQNKPMTNGYTSRALTDFYMSFQQNAVYSIDNLVISKLF